MTVDVVISGTVVTHEGVYAQTSIAVHEGKIVSIGTKASMPVAEKEVDYGELLILPGVVDNHVHSVAVKEEGFWNSTSSAAAGGVTTINDMPLDLGGAPTSSDDIKNKARRAANEAVVDFSLIAGALPEKLEDITEVADSGITSYKILMHSTSGAADMRAVEVGELYTMVDLIAKANQTAFVHAENESMINHFVDKWIKEGRTYLAAHHETRPEMTEVIADNTAIEVARAVGGHLHIVHTTTPKGFELVKKARKEGVRVTAETCPHYLVCNEDRWKEVGSHFKINPPLRSEQTRQALWDELKKGRIHLIASDHAPHSGQNYPNVFDVYSGNPGVETMLPLIYSEGVHQRHMGLNHLVKLLSYHPARLMGVYPQKGTIAVGSDADLVVFDPKKEWVIEGKTLRSQSGWTMYEGMDVTGKVLGTYVRGTKVFEEGKVIGQRGHGEWVKKSSADDFF